MHVSTWTFELRNYNCFSYFHVCDLMLFHNFFFWPPTANHKPFCFQLPFRRFITSIFFICESWEIIIFFHIFHVTCHGDFLHRWRKTATQQRLRKDRSRKELRSEGIGFRRLEAELELKFLVGPTSRRICTGIWTARDIFVYFLFLFLCF